MRISLTADDVDDGKDHHPHDIDEVPVQSQDLNAFGVLLLYMPGDCEEEHSQQCDQPDDDMGSMQPDQRIERGPEEICSDRESVLVNQLVPLKAGSHKENRA